VRLSHQVGRQKVRILNHFTVRNQPRAHSGTTFGPGAMRSAYVAPVHS
jgi:hypothetical protein